MKSQIKDAVITTAIVLAVIFAARRVPVIGPVVDRAISG